jgi:hypothetical protein
VLNLKCISFLLFLLLHPAAFSACGRTAGRTEWKTYRYEGEVSFTVAYPASWSAARLGNVVRFTSPGAGSGHIELVVYNPDVTPPLAVNVTYDTLRVVQGRSGPVPVMQRAPAAVTERSVALVSIERHVVEVRLMAEREYDAVFDHMLVTLTPYQLNPR